MITDGHERGNNDDDDKDKEGDNINSKMKKTTDDDEGGQTDFQTSHHITSHHITSHPITIAIPFTIARVSINVRFVEFPSIGHECKDVI